MGRTPQSGILNHLVTRRDSQTTDTAWTHTIPRARTPPVRRPISPTSISESEGSEGLAAIQFSQASRHDDRTTARVQRPQRRVELVDEDDRDDSKGKENIPGVLKMYRGGEASRGAQEIPRHLHASESILRPVEDVSVDTNAGDAREGGTGREVFHDDRLGRNNFTILEDPPGSFDLAERTGKIAVPTHAAMTHTHRRQRRLKLEVIIEARHRPRKLASELSSSHQQPASTGFEDSMSTDQIESRRAESINAAYNTAAWNQSSENSTANDSLEREHRHLELVSRHPRLTPVVEITSLPPSHLAVYLALDMKSAVNPVDMSPGDVEARDEDDIPLVLPTPFKRKQNSVKLANPLANAMVAVKDKGKGKASPPDLKRPSREELHGGRKRSPAPLRYESDSVRIIRNNSPLRKRAKVSTHDLRQKNGRRPVRLKGSARDPDEEEHESSESGDDIEDLRLDEPERFATVSRLRKRKETTFQRQLRKVKAKREGREISLTGDESSQSRRTYTSDSAPDSDAEDFIVDDGGRVQEGLLPHEFSSNVAQTPEFKFKVVFHYMVLLVIKGPKVLPIRGKEAEYFGPFLADWRRKMTGHRESRVRSQIWRSDFIHALKKFPDFVTTVLDCTYEGCDACHMSGRRSRYEVRLEGHPYHPETHEPLDTETDEGSDLSHSRNTRKVQGRKKRDEKHTSSPESRSAEPTALPQLFRMGRFCKARALVYHEMTHWEDSLYYSVRGYYHDLLRAKYQPVPSDSEASSTEEDTSEDEEERRERRERRSERRRVTELRVSRLRRHPLVAEWRNVDKVTEWMDRERGYQASQYRWINDMITRSERLELDKSTDD